MADPILTGNHAEVNWRFVLDSRQPLPYNTFVSSLSLRFMGWPRFERDDQLFQLSSAKAVALLAYLAVSRTPQTRDRLLNLLWAESSPDAARKNLRNTLWTIRKSLDEDMLLSSDDHLSLEPGIWIDVREFERLAELPPTIENLQSAIALYRGSLLEGLVLTEAPEFEIWLTTEREHLRQLHARLLETLVNTFRAKRDWPQVIAMARRALAHDNLQEPMYRALMEAHAQLGERAEALRQYDILQTTLARELDVEPLPETQALRAAIVSGAFDQLASSPSAIAPRTPKRLPISGDSPRPPFVGRQAERAALDAELEIAASDQLRIVLMSGQVGIGKSRLWQEWSAGFAPGTMVLESQCLEVTRTVPFAPLIELFSSRPCVQHLFTAPSPVPSIWLAEVARLLPEIRAALPDLPAPAVLPPEEERYRLLEAFTQCLHALDAHPLVFFIDDLHWADRATLDWLDYVVHHLRAQPLLLVGAYRPEEAPAALARLAASWSREHVLRRLPLSPLTDAESMALVESLGGDPGRAAHIQAQSAGNPYFLIELCRAAPGDVPPVLSELIRARLDQLPDPARQVLQAATVLEPDFDFATLRRTSGRGEEETLDALDVLLDLAVLVERGGRYAFAHPLVAAVIRGGLSQARRIFLHRRAAEALEATYAGRVSQVAGQLATHYAQADLPARAANYAEMAADRALALAAPAEAVDLYRQALALGATPSRQMGLGRALQGQGDSAGAREAFSSALRGFEAQGDRRGAARACLSLAETYLPIGQAGEMMHWAEKSLSYLDAEVDPEAHAQAHFMFGAAQLRAEHGSLAEAERHLNEAARLATESKSVGMAARSRFELGNLLAQRGELADAVGAFLDSISLGQAAGDQWQQVLGHNNAAYHLLLMGDLAGAREHVEAGLALAEAHALGQPLQYLHSTRGEIALAEHKWDEAESWFERGLAEAEQYDNPEQAANLRANLGLAARGRGDLDGALMLLEGARASAASLTTPHLQTRIDLWLVELYLERGERAAANEALERAQVRLAGSERKGLQKSAEQLKAQIAK